MKLEPIFNPAISIVSALIAQVGLQHVGHHAGPVVNRLAHELVSAAGD